MNDPFTIDDAHDRRNADTGTRSRYLNYVRLNLGLFTSIWDYGLDDLTAEFAATSWRIANGPVMAPGLVEWHPRILSADVARSTWDGALTADVTLISRRPDVLEHARSSRGDYMAGWPASWLGDYRTLTEEDLSKRPYLLATAKMLWSLPTDTVSSATDVDPGNFDEVASMARRHVEELVAALNRETRPIIAALDGGDDRG